MSLNRKICVATCSLNQWALDFDGNVGRIALAMKMAHTRGAGLLVTPELSIPGYGCQDHFLESDTFLHSWEALVLILEQTLKYPGFLISVGMPVMYHGVAYNCQVFAHDGLISLIRPKHAMCDDMNYRESRWFSGWSRRRQIGDVPLPEFVAKVAGQTSAKFGDGVLQTCDTCIGAESCEELWTADSPHIPMGQDGVEVFCNASASHHELRKAYYAVELIVDATKKSGGVYLFANQIGGDGDRLYYNGNACIVVNGFVVARGRQFSLTEVEVVSMVIDLEDVRTYRNMIRSSSHGAAAKDWGVLGSYPRISLDELRVLSGDHLKDYSLPVLTPIQWDYESPEQEIAFGPACYLWDYLRRSGQAGYFLPLSGGKDSAAVACIVYSMCRLVFESAFGANCDEVVLADLRRLVGDPGFVAGTPEEICSRLLFTAYLGTINSSDLTRQCASGLAHQIGSNHREVVVDPVVEAAMAVFTKASGKHPEFAVNGGSVCENTALQNVQARTRMVMSYLFAQLLPWSCNFSQKSLLVLATANVDEALRGYMTKYDCSSGDINPIGGISKTDLNSLLLYCRDEFGLTSLKAVLDCAPTAELVPLSSDGSIRQSDEEEMGLTYSELSVLGKLRKPGGCGPWSMFLKLLSLWKNERNVEEIGRKVKHFFRFYSINRHKMTVLTPAYHAESYSPDDHRFDHRPFLYNVSWPWQFRKIDAAVKGHWD